MARTELLEATTSLARRQARRQAARLAGLDNTADLVRRIVADQQVRAATSQAMARVRNLGDEIDRADLRSELGRLARDRALQEQVAATLRAVTAVLDAGADVPRRQARHRVRRVLLVGGAVGAVSLVGAAAARRLQARRIWPASEEAVVTELTEVTELSEAPPMNGGSGVDSVTLQDFAVDDAELGVGRREP